MKRFILLLVVGLTLASLVLTACGTGSSPTSATSPTASATASPISQTSEKIRVATDATWPPFESVNEQTKEIEGLDIDIMKAIAAKANLEVEFVNVAWDPLLAGMAQDMYDAAISSITITEERQADMAFSDPYFAAGQLVVVRIDNTTITGKDTVSGQVGVQLGTTGDIETQKIQGAVSKPYDDIGMAFQDLMNGQVTAVICDNPVAMQYVNKNADKIKIVGDVFTDESYGIAVAKNKTELLKKINAGLTTVKAEGLIEQYAAKWLK